MSNYWLQVYNPYGDFEYLPFDELKEARRFGKALIYDGMGGDKVTLFNTKGNKLKIPTTPITAFEKEISKQVRVHGGESD